jgi:glycosyltransferase involved in cell wall biosynthesis
MNAAVSDPREIVANRESARIKCRRIACTGFISEEAGSVAAANALLLRALLETGIGIDFFSKPSFVDPRPAVGVQTGFRFVPTINSYSDGLHRKVTGIPLVEPAAARNDAVNYNRLLARRIAREHVKRNYAAVLWMGDYAHGSIRGVPTISFAQGPPGTDARSILRRRGDIRSLAGRRAALKWEILARLRLSPLGLPSFHNTAHFIVGSSVSREILVANYGIPRHQVSTLPYPIDLDLFKRSHTDHFDCPPPRHSCTSPLRVLWLGRIVPRKRLDLLLNAAGMAIEQGLDMRLTIAGRIGFVSGYDRLINAWPYPERINWIQSVPRPKVPALIGEHDILVQPSEEENFGSSVAEAQACGIPVIVGNTNGNADYLCARDIRLSDYLPESLACALCEMGNRKKMRQLGDPLLSRAIAEKHFSIQNVAGCLSEILDGVIKEHGTPVNKR